MTRRLPGGLIIQPVALLSVAALFFGLNGISPLPIFARMLHDSFGGAFSFSQTLLNGVIISLCALSVALPARLAGCGKRRDLRIDFAGLFRYHRGKSPRYVL